MDSISFSTQVITGIPILIITPYGIPILEMMNIIIESLRRANIPNIYIDREYVIDDNKISIYENGPGIILMTDIADNITYNTYITPIYFVEWGIRNNNIKQYHDWIYPGQQINLFPTFLPAKQSPNIIPHIATLTSENYIAALEHHELLNMTYIENIESPRQFNLQLHPVEATVLRGLNTPDLEELRSSWFTLPDTSIHNGGWITDDVLNYLYKYSPKISALAENIISPCAIYCPYVERYGLNFIHEKIKRFGYPIYTVYTINDYQNLTRFNNSRIGFLLTNNINNLIGISQDVPIHIINLDSSQGIDLMIEPHHHNVIHIYIATGPNNESTADISQYTLLISGINDANQVFERLIGTSRHLTIDKYNNLYINR